MLTAAACTRRRLSYFSCCFAAADTWEDVRAAVREAAEAHFYGKKGIVPSSSALKTLARNSEYEGGVWMLFDIDLSKISSKAVRFNVNMPERLLQRIDTAANARKLTQTSFLFLAEEHEVPAHA